MDAALVPCCTQLAHSWHIAGTQLAHSWHAAGTQCTIQVLAMFYRCTASQRHPMRSERICVQMHALVLKV